jgi:sugar lactone lactonase YvrE
VFELLYPIELEPGFRSNDGKIDLDGNFWWSVMDDDGGRRPGAIYRTTPLGRTERMLTGIHIPNTISFCPDGGTLYVADSRFQRLFAHPADDLNAPREFASTEGEAGTPDGSAMDIEGFLWNAQWGGWRVVRYAPDGSVDQVVPMPVEQPTSLAFGGPDLATLYVTSAWDGLSPGDRERQPQAGSLFAFDPGVRGLPLPAFAG